MAAAGSAVALYLFLKTPILNDALRRGSGCALYVFSDSIALPPRLRCHC
jgi:hypothetical protein